MSVEAKQSFNSSFSLRILQALQNTQSQIMTCRVQSFNVIGLDDVIPLLWIASDGGAHRLIHPPTCPQSKPLIKCERKGFVVSPIWKNILVTRKKFKHGWTSRYWDLIFEFEKTSYGAGRGKHYSQVNWKIWQTKKGRSLLLNRPMKKRANFAR